jgi:periplasmic divalent cation tolerance protein
MPSDVLNRRRKGEAMAEPNERFQLVLTTAGSEEQARTIARELVDRRLAACVSILPQACSVYRWEGKVQEEDEKLLLIKTAQRLFPRLREAIRELHSYDVPELLAIPIEAGDETYLGWLNDCLTRD